MRILRKMAPDDLDAVLALEQRTPGAPHWAPAVYRKLQQSSEALTLVSFEDQTLSGFVAATQVVDICELETIVVAEEFRRKGIGAALLRAILDWAAGRGARRVELEVRAANAGAVALYERHGFAQDGRRCGYYQHPEDDALLMGRPITESYQSAENCSK